MPIPRTETSEIVKEIAASGEFGSMLSSIPSDKLSAAMDIRRRGKKQA